ncbi:MAG TPA: hypothetical protein VEW42_00860 [Candidatus Eisenbacteria bacterium]|nr:hypothetical protein [Candidatus Eisenbacteria bacterium]
MRYNAEASKKLGPIRQFIHNTEERIHTALENGAERKVAKILANPKKYKKAIRREFERAFHEATKTPTQDNERARRDALQLTLYPASHIPLPLPINIIAVPAIPVFHGIPLLLSSSIVTGFYNIPNTHEALIEKRYGKAMGYAALSAIALFPIPIPFVHNTITYDVVLRPLGRETNKQVLARAQEVMATQDVHNEQFRAFADAFQEFAKKKSRRRKPLEERLQESLQETGVQKILAQKEKEVKSSNQGKPGRVLDIVNVYGSFKRKRLEDIVDDKILAINQLQQLLKAQRT